MQKQKTESKIPTLAELKAERKDYENPKISFDIPPDSFERDMLDIAANHYSGGTAYNIQAWRNSVAKMVLIEWLRDRVDFPQMNPTWSDYPLEPSRKVEGQP